MFDTNPNHHFHHGYTGQMMHQFPFDQQQFINRNQPIPSQTQPPGYEWMLYQQQHPYYQPSIPPYGQAYQPGYTQQQVNPYPNQSFSQKDHQYLFQNPLQPKEDLSQQQLYMPINGYQMMNPYPKNNLMLKQSGGVQSLMNSFKSQDGKVDLNKMVNTAGQMMNAVTQVSSLVKGIGGFFKV